MEFEAFMYMWCCSFYHKRKLIIQKILRQQGNKNPLSWRPLFVAVSVELKLRYRSGAATIWETNPSSVLLTVLWTSTFNCVIALSFQRFQKDNLLPRPAQLTCRSIYHLGGTTEERHQWEISYTRIQCQEDMHNASNTLHGGRHIFSASYILLHKQHLVPEW